MKIKNHIRLLSALLVISSSMNVLADNSKTTEKKNSNIINFSGTVTSTSCNIESPNSLITLPVINKSEIVSDKDWAKAKSSTGSNFEIKLLDCGNNNAALTFNGTDLASENKILKNKNTTNNGAKGVGIFIRSDEGNKNIIHLNGNQAITKRIENKTVTYKFHANYASYLPNPTSGTVNTSISFTIKYS
ncbi:type 1 fimbrial protein [Proteus mirabilis]|uniref:fimbrial protein n=1 Tax=Proteus mirabilis TaxID=584 RepID=UPI00144947AF|nr:fimbrial protein [Proteus mirabilis]QJB73221.1 type 1 fimbrial protein [Proteus mirabilis]